MARLLTILNELYDVSRPINMHFLCYNLFLISSKVLVALDYSRTSRHLLVTTGDEGSIHLWDTTGQSPKVCIAISCCKIFCFFKSQFLVHKLQVSWWKQHTAPATGVAFSPTNDKVYLCRIFTSETIVRL